MEENQRYTVEYCDDQLLLQVDCPVHVKKLQCTRDSLTGRWILQARMVNRSERTVESVCIHVSLRNERGAETACICSLRLTGLYARAHQCFGDEKSIILPTGFTSIEVIVEQVSFSDGYLWMRKPESPILPILPPERIGTKVQPMRYEGYWYCHCGMVNPSQIELCSYCLSPMPRVANELLDYTQPEPAPMQEGKREQKKAVPVPPPQEEDPTAAEEFPDFSISPKLQKTAHNQKATAKWRWIWLAGIVALAVGVAIWLLNR